MIYIKKVMLLIFLLPFLPLVILRRWYWGPKVLEPKVLIHGIEQKQSDVTYQLESIKQGETIEVSKERVPEKPQPTGYFWQGTLIEALDDKHLYNIIMACERGTWITYKGKVNIEPELKTALYADYNYRKDCGKYGESEVAGIQAENLKWEKATRKMNNY